MFVEYIMQLHQAFLDVFFPEKVLYFYCLREKKKLRTMAAKNCFKDSRNMPYLHFVAFNLMLYITIFVKEAPLEHAHYIKQNDFFRNLTLLSIRMLIMVYLLNKSILSVHLKNKNPRD